jgi:uncharacterized membrane protein AbrB (regulator of aidB expression)
MKRALAVVMAALVSTAGCSIAFVDGPHVVAGKVTCTEEMTLPLVDAAIAAVAITAPFIHEFTRDRSSDPLVELSVVSWAVGLGTAISAIVGVRKVKRCRRSIAADALTAPPTTTP